MFGMGFMEIFLILVVAVIALGPEKLPSAAVDIAKFFKKFKNTIDEAKTNIDNELNISQMKQEAEELRASISNVNPLKELELDDMTNLLDDEPSFKSQTTEKKVVVNDEIKTIKPMAQPKRQNNSMYQEGV